MQYSAKDYEFLGKEVARGRYVRRSTFALSLVLVFLLGICFGRYLLPHTSGQALDEFSRKKPLGEQSGMAVAVNPNKQLYDSILQHEESVRVDPKNAEAWEHLGNLYFDAKEPAKSVNAYEKALELSPGNPNVMVDCGVMYRELKRYDKALELFQKALKVNPKHEYALFNSGIVLYHDLNRKEEAMEAWRNLVRLNPEAKTPSGELVRDMMQKH